jgi:hypothetical protein
VIGTEQTNSNSACILMTKGLTAVLSEMECDQTAIGLPLGSSAVKLFVCKNSAIDF